MDVRICDGNIPVSDTVEDVGAVVGCADKDVLGEGRGSVSPELRGMHS
jgi:hypothetical protein